MLRKIKSLPSSFILRHVWYCEDCLENTYFNISQSSCGEQAEQAARRLSVIVEQADLMTKGFEESLSCKGILRV